MSSPGGVWAKVYPDSMVLGNGRNLLYNGAMQVHQRGMSATGITGRSYNTADRWNWDLRDAGTWTQTVEDDGPQGFSKSLKTVCSSTGTFQSNSSVRLQQILEGQDLQHLAKGTPNTKPLTLSFWCKSNVTGTFINEMEDRSNGRSISTAFTVDNADTWESKIITVPGDTVGPFANINDRGLGVCFWLDAGTDFTSGTLNTSWDTRVNENRVVGVTNLGAAVGNYFQVTGVQLEIGETATSFEHKKYGTELAECQRYYEVIADSKQKSICNAAYYGDNWVMGNVHFATKRSRPTLIATKATDAYEVQNRLGVDKLEELQGAFISLNNCRISNASANGQVGVSGVLTTSLVEPVLVAMDAEL